MSKNTKFYFYKLWSKKTPYFIICSEGGVWCDAIATEEPNPFSDEFRTNLWIGWFASKEDARNEADFRNKNCDLSKVHLDDNSINLDKLSDEHRKEIQNLIEKYKEEDKETWLEEYCKSWYRPDGIAIKQYQVDSITSFAKEFIDRCRLEMEKCENTIGLNNLIDIAKDMGVKLDEE